MEKYIVVIFHSKGTKVIGIKSDKYPSERDISVASSIDCSDIISYEIHY